VDIGRHAHRQKYSARKREDSNGEVLIMSGMKYTRCLDNTGWLRVRIVSPDSDGYLCEFTKVQLTREGAGRQFFKILDGWISVGKEASMSSAHARQLLSDVAPGGAAKVEVKYDGQPEWETSPFKGPLLQQWANESFNGEKARVTLNSVWDEHFTPIPPGTHSIMAPDASHAKISTIGYAMPCRGCLGTTFGFRLA
jgi:hypothetical protein